MGGLGLAADEPRAFDSFSQQRSVLLGRHAQRFSPDSFYEAENRLTNLPLSSGTYLLVLRSYLYATTVSFTMLATAPPSTVCFCVTFCGPILSSVLFRSWTESQPSRVLSLTSTLLGP